MIKKINPVLYLISAFAIYQGLIYLESFYINVRYHPLATISIWLYIIIFVHSLVLSLGLIVSGVCLIKLNNWTRILVIYSITMDFLVRLSGAIIYAYNSMNPPSLPPLTDATNITFISLWPSYIKAFIELLIIYYLTRSHIKEQFK